MEYQFTMRFSKYPSATFEMGGEAFGYWFSDELRDDQTKITNLINTIQRLHDKQIQEFKLTGKNYDLLLSSEEVEVRSHAYSEDEAPEGAEWCSNVIAGCGLQDFESVLLSWKDFTQSAL
ncbi:YacL family protein [Planctobacterium marinum]|uniref:Uncharacterized protein n=1 Tax=Planctobacterium marinum TaxID=1631968 RepID=A0AA48KNZ2_9ALTE|nr:hypothetical protein MACH26_03990 [Planctobacterium marinum]